MTRVTPHFSVEEFDQPARHGLLATPYPPEWVEGRLRPLCEALEALRERLGGRPVRVLSGYRSGAYNRAVGGARASQHLEGRAADVTVRGRSPEEVLAAALALYAEGVARIGGLGLYPGFVHLDVRPGRLVRWGGSRTET